LIKIINILSGRISKTIGAILLFIFTTNNIVNADSLKVPLNIQSAMISKLVKYNSKLSSKSRVKMLIVYNSKTSDQKNLMQSQLQEIMDIKCYTENEIGNIGKIYDIVYFMPGCEGLSYICKNNKMLSVSGVAKFVQNGNISIAIATENDKLKIFVNLTSLRAEEQSMSTDILRISKVYK
jgi:hypothetical protein